MYSTREGSRKRPTGPKSVKKKIKIMTSTAANTIIISNNTDNNNNSFAYGSSV